MQSESKKPKSLKSVVHRDAQGQIVRIDVVETDTPTFHTPAFDELMKNGGIPAWLRRRAD